MERDVVLLHRKYNLQLYVVFNKFLEVRLVFIVLIWFFCRVSSGLVKMQILTSFLMALNTAYTLRWCNSRPAFDLAALTLLSFWMLSKLHVLQVSIRGLWKDNFGKSFKAQIGKTCKWSLFQGTWLGMLETADARSDPGWGTPSLTCCDDNGFPGLESYWHVLVQYTGHCMYTWIFSHFLACPWKLYPHFFLFTSIVIF
mgnify:CR=1 FL=1